jgi:hypothetical protein
MYQPIGFSSFARQGFGKPAIGKSAADSSILTRIKSLMAAATKPPQQLAGDMGYICSGCGKNGGELEMHEQTTQITLQNNHTAPSFSGQMEMRVRGNNDKFNQTYIATFMRLQRQHVKQSNCHIPMDILRETAHLYATICHQGVKTEDGIKKDTHRHNLILSSLLQNQLDKAKLSRPDGFVCQFTGIGKSKLTKSKNRLQTFIKSGVVEHVHPYDRIPNFVYLFLTKLGVDTAHTDLVVAIIRRADEQVDMIHFRTCQDNSKVVGAIWLIARQLNMKLQHQTIFDNCERISKSTYIRYVEFLDYNRRRINPILVKNKIRPIPKSFAETLPPLDPKYAADFQYFPDPEKPAAPVKKATKKSTD